VVNIGLANGINYVFEKHVLKFKFFLSLRFFLFRKAILVSIDRERKRDTTVHCTLFNTIFKRIIY